MHATLEQIVVWLIVLGFEGWAVWYVLRDLFTPRRPVLRLGLYQYRRQCEAQGIEPFQNSATITAAGAEEGYITPSPRDPAALLRPHAVSGTGEKP